MKYILDTDTLIYFLKGHESVVRQIIHAKENSVVTTIINQAELLFGAFNSARKKDNLAKIKGLLHDIEVLPFCEKSSFLFAESKAKLKKSGAIIADMDLMIASICLQNNLTLVTNNKKHFQRIKGLKLENWARDV